MYLFDTEQLHVDLEGRKVGVASSVRAALWQQAEIYPEASNPLLTLSTGQRAALALFAANAEAPG